MKLCRVTLVTAVFGGLFVVLMIVSLNIKSEKKTVMAISAMDNQTAIIKSEQVIDETEKNMTVVSLAATGDARPLLVKKYLEKYHSPLLPYAEMIVELSDVYGFDYYWMVAIAQQESNLCKVIPDNSHNCWGYGINSAGTLKFDNYELALKSYAEYLKRAYFDQGLNTPELIMKKYCPHSNGSWAFGVNQFIKEIEDGSF
jgi:hypothetical protein